MALAYSNKTICIIQNKKQTWITQNICVNKGLCGIGMLSQKIGILGY